MSFGFRMDSQYKFICTTSICKLCEINVNFNNLKLCIICILFR